MTIPFSDQFAEFYKAVYGKEGDRSFGPFPWQERVAASVCDGKWPRAIALPTAAGKTACLDIAVFALACRAENAPRRIFFTVDRRIVVDQAWRHAMELAKRLQHATDGILKEVADSLREIASVGKNDAPLDVYALRGGMYRETAWVRSPLQPTMIASTVDQVGSRLLFRGYGVSDSMKPVHAGLVGNDALILLDEAHCSKPFCQTMEAVEKYRQWNESPAPFRFVSITVTPSGDIPTEEIERDRDDDRFHPILGKRIKASKPAALVVADKAKGKSQKAADELVKKLETWAKKIAASKGTVGIIVNRVATARKLKKRLGDEAVLLTGRMRPLDRDRLFEECLKPLLSNASNTEGTPPKFVIGTQCLEVGADFDFHALVTECASLDALRQRFGRLNRVAKRPDAKAVVVIRGDQTEIKEKDSDRDPIYGNSLPTTWRWLNDHKDGDRLPWSDRNGNAEDNIPWIDLGIASVRVKWEATLPEERDKLNAPSRDAPVLFPVHLDCWVQTHPIPTPDPDVAVFLHGPNNSTPDVQVVLRSDLGEEDEQWPDVVALCPPSSSEAVAVPLAVFRRWLAGQNAIFDASGDTEGEPDEENADTSSEPSRRALCWKGPKSSKVILHAKDVRPGSTYVLSKSAPGIDQLGDFPFGSTDLGEEAYLQSRDKAILRLCQSKLDDEEEDFDEKLTEEIRSSADEENTSAIWRSLAVDCLKDPNNRFVEKHPNGGWVVGGKRRLGQFKPEFLDDDDSSYAPAGRAILLDDHSCGVADRARRFAADCGLEADTFALAGQYHDLGKLDPRFQRVLRGFAGGKPLAKSGSYRRRNAAVHGYPKGARHELLSSAMVSIKSDDDLLLHLIATHHGAGRPFADPVAENGRAVAPFTQTCFGTTFELPSSAQEIATWNAILPERFWRMVRNYGWWGAAYREAVFRLADHAVSREEQGRRRNVANRCITQISLSPTDSTPQQPHVLTLTGLDGANPLAFMAAIGTLRLASQIAPDVLLKWEYIGKWQPVLELTTPLTKEAFIEGIYKAVHRTIDDNAANIAKQQYIDYRSKKKETANAFKQFKERKLRGKERDIALIREIGPFQDKEKAARQSWLQALEAAAPAPFLSLGKSIAASAEEFADFAMRALHRLHVAGADGRIDADFISAFACEACVNRNGTVIPTEFQFITGSGHQFFLQTLGSLMDSITRDQIQRSLFSTWTYQDSKLSFRWDPADDRRYAVNWSDPSSMEVHTEHAANLLAAFGLPLFPVVPVLRDAVTMGFSTHEKQKYFSWPLWELPLSTPAVQSLLHLKEIHSDVLQWSILRYYGIKAACRTQKIEVGNPPLSKLNFSDVVMI